MDIEYYLHNLIKNPAASLHLEDVLPNVGRAVLAIYATTAGTILVVHLARGWYIFAAKLWAKTWSAIALFLRFWYSTFRYVFEGVSSKVRNDFLVLPAADSSSSFEPTDEEEEEEYVSEPESETESEPDCSSSPSLYTYPPKCRDLRLCMRDKQKIKHTYGGHTWVGVYHKDKNAIIYQGRIFSGRSPLKSFALTHAQLRGSRRTTIAAWKECMTTFDDRTWVSTENLPEL